ncbi:hypothetical protein I5Q83_20360 [Enterocloster clostridioformis]|uniref:hypothetical protein n=1 Tax=Enterocloster clostridioformis TaxID=1531 RepID=UPI0012F49FAE|nr:hypothetical protein [Enterocloster clostridioformis]QQQ98499.1 hypothetical protein I5Q83_20360 [Enterocloster clostridioformis]
MTENARNKAAISEETIEELSRYVLGAIPVMAKVDMTSEEMNFYDKLVSMPWAPFH